MVGDRQLRRLKAAERKRLILFLFIYIIPDSIPDSATGDVEEELRLALIAQKKKSLKRKAEAPETQLLI